MRHGIWMLLWAAATCAQAQAVWKCQVGAQVRYSDRPCPEAGEPVSRRRLQPNLVDGAKPQLPRAEPSASAIPPIAAPAFSNACPSDAEIRGMETRASSTTFGDEERQFMQDEVRRARQCRKGQGRYSEADWAISREAQAAQSNLKGAYDARLRAEGMHSAADPEEGERIFRRNLTQARLQRQEQARERQRERAVQNPPAPR